MKTSEKLDQLLPALTKARQNFQEIKKSKTNPHYKSKYAALDDILPAIVPALAAEGLLLIGDLCNGQEGIVTVTTRLMHISEQWIESRVDLSYQFGNLQKLGGEVTYTRRYSINTMLQLAADDDLDEQGPPEVVNRRPRASTAERIEPPSSAALTAEELKALTQLADMAGLDTIKFGDDMRLLLNLAPGAKLTRKFLCETMTRAQFEERWQRYRDLIEANQDTDVPDFSIPAEEQERLLIKEADKRRREQGIHPNLIDDGYTNLKSTDDEVGKVYGPVVETAPDNGPYASLEQLDGLELLAGDIPGDLGLKEVAEVKAMRARHRYVDLKTYQEVREKLLMLQAHVTKAAVHTS